MDVGIDETPVGSNGIDAAENVYGTAKGVFLWTKKVPVVGFISGMSEAVANKALNVVGTNLPEIDYHVEKSLHTIDGRILNPVLGTVVSLLMTVGSKTEDIVMPIVDMVTSSSSPFGLLSFFIKSQAEETTPFEAAYDHSTTTTTPEVVVVTTTTASKMTPSISTETMMTEMTDFSSIDADVTSTKEASPTAAVTTAPTTTTTMNKKKKKNVLTGRTNKAVHKVKGVGGDNNTNTTKTLPAPLPNQNKVLCKEMNGSSEMSL